MSAKTDVSSVTNFFPKPQNGFVTTLGSTITHGASTVPLAGTGNFSNGDVVVLVIEPTSATTKEVFTGIIDTSGIQVTSCIWTVTQATNPSHAGGVSIVDYTTATHIQMTTKGILVAHNTDGTHKSGATYAAPVFSGTATGTYTLGGTATLTAPTITTMRGWDGWQDANESWAYASATTITVPTDATTKYSVGDKIKLTQSATVKYFYIVGVAATVLTITGGSDYTFANAAVTANYFSKDATPLNFPHWFAYAPSYTGFSANPSGGMGARFNIVGRIVQVNHQPSTGTSNGTAFTIGLPVTASSISNGTWRQFGKAVDNGVPLNGFVEILSAGTVATIYKDSNGTLWTGSGSKTYQGFIWYEI